MASPATSAHPEASATDNRSTSRAHWLERLPLPWSRNGDRARLLREYETFRIELNLLAARYPAAKVPWLKAAEEQLKNIPGSLKKDIEGGWAALNAAKRHAIHALEGEALHMQASMLRAEASKFSSWRADEIKKLLSVEDARLTAERVIDAMELRDVYFSNQYHKIWMVGDQLAILLVLCGLGLVLLFAPLVICYSLHLEAALSPWGFAIVLAVIFFGLLGASCSAAGSLMDNHPEAKVPERVANGFVTTARALFGAGIGLAGYAFYQSKILEIHAITAPGTGAALAVAFLFGFAGEKLIANVLGSLGAQK